MISVLNFLQQQEDRSAAFYNRFITKLYPISISRRISRDQADEFSRQTGDPKNYLGSGFNGDVFRVHPGKEDFTEGRRLVLKVHRGNEARANKNKFQEVEKLKLLNELIRHHGQKAFGVSQIGLAAFSQPGGNSCILTTLVPGHNPDPNLNPFTKSALHDLIEKIAILDQGTPELGRFMHYDLSNKNINITHKKAGIFDWEYLSTIRLDHSMKSAEQGVNHSHCNVSDTFASMPSNIRNFELRSLHYYLCTQSEKDPKSAREFFKMYLQEKANYHQAMVKHYQKIKIRPPEDLEVDRSIYMANIKKMIESESSHAFLLKGTNGKTPLDIQKAELIKLELCYYTWITSPHCMDGEYNGKQVGETYDRGRRFFGDQLEKAVKSRDRDRQCYYKNCLEVLDTLDPFLNSGIPDNQKPARETGLTGPVQPDLLKRLYYRDTP